MIRIAVSAVEKGLNSDFAGDGQAMRGQIKEIGQDGEILHVEIEMPDGETVVGIYELIGWTTPPKEVKQKTELEIWVPPKASFKVN